MKFYYSDSLVGTLVAAELPDGQAKFLNSTSPALDLTDSLWLARFVESPYDVMHTYNIPEEDFTHFLAEGNDLPVSVLSLLLGADMYIAECMKKFVKYDAPKDAHSTRILEL